MNNQINKLTNWKNEPTVDDLKEDYVRANASYAEHRSKVEEYLKALDAPSPVEKSPTHSAVQPKLIRKQAEWRYAALSEPFLADSDMIHISPRSYEDGYAAKQNQIILNYQFNEELDKVHLIDTYIRCAVNEGTAVLRVGWDSYKEQVESPNTQYTIEPITDPLEAKKFNQIQALAQDDINSEVVPTQWLDALQVSQEETQKRQQEAQQQAQELINFQMQQIQQSGQEVDEEQLQQMQQQIMQQAMSEVQPAMYKPVPVKRSNKWITKEINKPDVEVLDYRDLMVDPGCMGDVSKAEYMIYVFDTCKADLIKAGIYTNLDHIEDETPAWDDRYYMYADNFRDPARKRITAYEYWGNWDINGDGTKTAIVATFVGSTMIRCELNPFPDHKPPFVIVPYLPVKNSVWGEPDGALLTDNQAIIGAVTRGMIDLLGKSANSQTGVAAGMLDSINRKRFEKGLDYQFNPAMPPQNGIFQHVYPEIPQSAFLMIQNMQQEAESLTGVRAFQGTQTSLGNTATEVRGALDAASKREMGILRRLAKGIEEVARKILTMNALWLNDEEAIRITNSEFIKVRKDDLRGDFDLKVDISSTEQDNDKADTIAFMMQTLGNTVPQPMVQLLIAEWCRLKKMPEMEYRIKNFRPEPDPNQQRLQEAQIKLAEAQAALAEAQAQKAQADAQKSMAEAQSTMVDAQLAPQAKQIEMQSNFMQAQAKSKYMESQARKMDLDYIQKSTGQTHREDMEKQGAQAKAQAAKSQQELAMKYMIEALKAKEKQNGSKSS